jgi:hypothetical protein
VPAAAASNQGYRCKTGIQSASGFDPTECALRAAEPSQHLFAKLRTTIEPGSAICDETALM